MSEPTASTHPEELLAGFVDGSLPSDERARVERHVASCERCTEEVSLAGEARSALHALPQLEAPGLTVQDLHVVTPITRARRFTRGTRIAWGAGIAAAAAVVVVFAVSSLHPSRTTSGTAAGPVAGKASGGLPGVVDNGTVYDQQSISSLASRLVAGEGRYTAAEPAPQFEPADQSAESSILSCLRQGAGLDASAEPTYLEIATYQGTPAYVGAFVTQPPTGSGSSTKHLLVVVVTQQGCQPLTVLRQPL